MQIATHERERVRLANVYLKGKGIEIGALHDPLPVPDLCEVTYIDRFPEQVLRDHYPELGNAAFRVDRIDDGESLITVEGESQDFVIACQFLEHCENPLLALQNHFRVLKPGGVLYLSVPDKRFTFDKSRPVTSLDHVRRDYEEGPQRSRKQYFWEWAHYCSPIWLGPMTAQQVTAKAEELERQNYAIHYHCWTDQGVVELALAARERTAFTFETITSNRSETEILLILRKG